MLAVDRRIEAEAEAEIESDRNRDGRGGEKGNVKIVSKMNALNQKGQRPPALRTGP